MEQSTDKVHLVSKSNNLVHGIADAPAPPTPLGPSSIRARTELISLTSNNLTYARLGSILNWWDAYPKPEGVVPPATTNSTGEPTEWGIVPAWGYARIVESTIPDIAPGSVLWGMFPTSSHLFDLQLQPAEPKGHWFETSPHRAKLMTLYNRFIQVPSTLPDKETMARSTLIKPVWGAAYALNKCVFNRSQPVHPLGIPSLPWSAEDADLRDAVVVSLSARTKTARGFAWELARNRDLADDGPVALVQMTTSPEQLATFSKPGNQTTSLAIHSYEYEDVESAIEEGILAHKPRRIVVFDFGAAADFVADFVSRLNEDVEQVGQIPNRTKPTVTFMGIGGEAKVYTKEDLVQAEELGRKLEKVQVNTSPLLDRAAEAQGAEAFWKEYEETFARYDGEKGAGEINLEWYRGVEGERGFYGAWEDLCAGKAYENVGIVVQVSGGLE